MTIKIEHRHIQLGLFLVLFSFCLSISGVYSISKAETYPIPSYGNIAGDTMRTIEVKGMVINNFKEIVDSVSIVLSSDTYTHSCYSDKEGRFSLIAPGSFAEDNMLRLTFMRYDYYPLDTVISIKSFLDEEEIEFTIFPKYKILLKGRIFAGSLPIDDVDVSVTYRDSIILLKTLGCYYDEEDYWNCLYNGMFKTEIVAENPDDSIYISFSKWGFQSQSHQLKFSDFPGEIINFKLKYADTVPHLPYNNIALKISSPLGENWFLGLSYYTRLNSNFFNRFRPGLEFSMMTNNRTQTLATLPGAPDTDFDTVYSRYFAGPSFVFFITKPYIRKFSTYLGSTFSLELTGGDFVFQPFLGTRFFIDTRKSFSIDLRYINYKIDVLEYTFIYNGNALSSSKEININKLLFNVGVQINF